MRSALVWVDTLKERDEGQCIYDIAFRPDGEEFVVASGNKLQIHSVKDGRMKVCLKGHRDTIYCTSYARSGDAIVSGGADKQVIVWGCNPYEGKLKFSHSDTIQCLSFSPVAMQVLSCTATDIGMWEPDQKSVQKSKVSSRCCSCCWTNDGQYFAVGHYNGTVTIWTKDAEEKVRIERPGGCPIWCLSWNPSREDQYDILTVCDWGQKMSYYQLNGRQIGKDRTLNFDATSLRYFPSGEFAVITGTNRKASIYSREGVFLGVVGEMLSSWTTVGSIRPGKNTNQLVIGGQDGTIALYQLTFSTVHGLYKERYAYRERMTEVVVQNLVTEEMVHIKCRDLVKKIAVYKNRLAIQLPEKIIVYELNSDDSQDMKYKIKNKFVHKKDCSLLVVCSSHVILCQEQTLNCFTFSGEKEREWVLDVQIRYIKVVGGPVGKESILVGLRNGQIFRIFVNNPFPNLLLKQQSAIRCMDLSLSRSKLAVVDENSILMVYDLTTKQLLYQEPNATSVSWNNQYEDMLCFSGSGYLSIKASNFPVHQLKQQGFVVGFSGTQIFCLNFFSMTRVDVPQSVSMIQFLERKNYKEAYKIACLGVTEGDWRILAMEVLEGMDLDTAKKAFIRIREMRFLELIHSIEERKRRGESNTQIFLADIYAYQGKFQEAAELYRRAGAGDKALEMFTDLREFEQAKKFMTSTNQDAKGLISKQADWAMNTNDPHAACEMYMAAGEYMKAIEIMGQNGWVDRLINLVHEMPKTETHLLNRCAYFLKLLSHPLAAAEVYEKIGDTQACSSLYIESKQWEMAFEFSKKHNQYKNEIYISYARWLMENDRFDEAHEAMHEAGEENEALHILEELALNAIKERRFSDASYYYWLLAKACLDTACKFAKDPEGSTLGIDKYIQKFYSSLDLADIYYVFYGIHTFMEQPFTSYLPEALLNMSRYLTLRTLKNCPRGISRVATLFTLAKQSKQLGAFKLARFAYDKLNSFCIPSTLQEAVELGSLSIRSKPFQDKEDLLPMCYRCSTINPLVNTAGNMCINCRQPFELSFVSFEALPVVEFILEDGISDEEALTLIKKEPPLKQQQQSTQWKEIHEENTQTLRFDDKSSTEVENIPDPFSANTYEGLEEFVPIVCGQKVLESLHRMEVIVKKWGPPIGNQYFKSLMPEISITVCPNCNKMFHSDDYELQVLSKGHCPFCRKTAQSL